MLVKLQPSIGRYYAMDRDKRWERVEKIYKAITEGEGETATSSCSKLMASYAKDVTDEFVLPTVVEKMVLQLQQSKKMIPLSSLTSVLTVQERLPEHSVQMRFDGFDRGARKNVRQLMYVSQSTM